MKNVIDHISSNLKKAQFGYVVETLTEPKMNKRGNPYYGRVKKRTIYTNAGIGVSYENAVNNRLERKGEERTFETQSPKGKKFYNDFFYQSVKDENVFYLKIGVYSQATKVESVTLVDGRPATDKELEDIKAFTPKPSPSKKQADVGLDEEEMYRLVSPKIENVLCIKQGDDIVHIQSGATIV